MPLLRAASIATGNDLAVSSGRCSGRSRRNGWHLWGDFISSKYDVRYGTLHLNEDGTLSIVAASPATGAWTTTGDPAVLAFDIKNAAETPEKTEMIIKGNEATLRRVSGMRYLKAD